MLGMTTNKIDGILRLVRYSHLFAKTTKSVPKDEVAVNAKLLIQGGFIDKLMAGSYTLLPLGRLVERKIEQIVREDMNATGAQEVLMPLLHPKEIWNETGRWDSAKEVMYQFEKDDKEYALSFTHEEIVLDLARKHIRSYKDLPAKIYHFSTKFRAELRAKSGILRGREFLMKDLYSLHATREDLDEYYFAMADVYKKTLKRIGLEAVVVESGGGVFTGEHTHELQVFSEVGEDNIYHCEKDNLWQNEEVVTDGKCFKCGGKLGEAKKSIEVGNIFRFGTDYCEKMNFTFDDKDGAKKYPYFGSYGIGITRLIGALVEASHDDRGIIWPESVAPYQVHLITLNKEHGTENKGYDIYKKLLLEGVEVLYDDREDTGAGQKFADADLIGIPVRLVVSAKTGDKIEWKERNKSETELLSIDEVLGRVRL
jgi:prolyl-tRNA synthetase